MTIKRLLAICFIVGCTSAAWFLLGGTVQYRSTQTDTHLGPEVIKNWGPVLTQEHPALFYEAPTGGNARREIQPGTSDIAVTLTYEPKQKGLLWYRTYKAEFTGKYLVKNPTPIAQTIYAAFKFPAADARYDAFSLHFGDKLTDKAPVNGVIRESLLLKPGEEVPLTVTYRATGLNQWVYSLASAKRLKNLHLAMTTNFSEINIPPFAESPTSRAVAGEGRKLQWDYTDVIGANAIAMDMPAVTNPGYVAGRMTFFRASLAALLLRGAGHRRHPRTHGAASDELFLSRRGMLRLPAPLRLSRRPGAAHPFVFHLRRRLARASQRLPLARDHDEVRGHIRSRAVRLHGAV
ncbi:MAG: hypothetical protein WDN28_08895 [Chthoniobacter sp.]